MNRYVRPNSLLQLFEEVHDLRLDRDVERRDGLVEHHHLRVQRERARDADPLPLTARELVREPIRMLRAEADRAQKLLDAAPPLVAAVQAVDTKRLADDLAHRHPRIE